MALTAFFYARNQLSLLLKRDERRSRGGSLICALSYTVGAERCVRPVYTGIACFWADTSVCPYI